MKNQLQWSMHRNLTVQILRKGVCRNDSPRLLKWCFSVTTEVRLPAWMSQAASLHLEKRLDSIISQLIFLHQNLDNPKHRVFVLLSIFNLTFPSVYTLNFLQTSIIQKPCAFKRGFAGKMFLNRSENWSRIVRMWASFSVFGKKLCFTPVVPPGSVIAMFPRKNFHRNMSFCDAQIEGIPKSTSAIEYHYAAFHFSPRIQCSNL